MLPTLEADRKFVVPGSQGVEVAGGPVAIRWNALLSQGNAFGEAGRHKVE